ncbi:ABC-type transport system, substrate-binding protein [Amycolatopsis marina]|uniref:ABC-type transport system, substrate-binding protein n=1 Tax=Amycolatopsis marina TaxID=490629 RepID=A0A1I1CAE4_9PSEU|nr:ABC transporter family substrate-binding protein [Amycolatopsis marina]SFB59621.1 ABC-type transport system, substrate-binding protein [Amycolatopsis marina]
MRSRFSRAGLSLSLVLVALVGCTNEPPPPVVTTPVAESSPVPEETKSQIAVGVDDIGGGYNPHNIADASTVTTALSQLLLPSVFRPEDDGTLALDETLMVSAEVTSRSPFTVAYDIRPDASWSDGAPIAAEDFIYLADAMRSEPGVVQPAGYRLIEGIESREGGKRVEVTFGKSYSGWRTLFDNLLPAHLLKDAPGGWRGALADSFPAYGGPFSIKTLDKARGEIILERNERYWEKPAAVDRLVLRSADQAGMAAALRSGNDQFAIARTNATGLNLFGELGQEIDLHRIARPRVASVLLRPVGTALADDQVRAGVAALIDRSKLIEEGVDGGPSATLRADAQVTPPSAAGYTPTLPSDAPIAKTNSAEAERLLTEAGYQREAGTWSRDGKTLSVVLAAPQDQEPYTGIAQELQRQLVAAGVEVRLVTPPARELFASQLAMPVASGQGDPTVNNTGNVGIDIAVVPQPTGGDPASTLASLFGCGLDRAEQAPDTPTVPANPAAFCVESLQPSIEAALTGAAEPAEALAELEPELWRQNVVIPLFQLADTLAVGDGVIGVASGPPLAGPFGAAVNWTRGAK